MKKAVLAAAVLAPIVLVLWEVWWRPIKNQKDRTRPDQSRQAAFWEPEHRR